MINFLRRWMDEILTATFLVMLVALARWRGAPIFAPLAQSGLTKRALLGVAALAVLLLGAKLLGLRALNLRRMGEYLVAFIPYLVALMVYESLKHMHATALTIWLGIHPKDSVMMAVDIALFGKTPYLWLAQWGLDGHIFISVMTFFYSLYYFAPIALLSWFMFMGQMNNFRLIRRGVLIVLYGGYCFYILIPVAGPLSVPAAVNPLFLDKMADFQYLMTNYRYSYDCFPSLHTALPWMLVLLSWKKLPRWLTAVALTFAVGITISTIALRFHYGIDVIAGLVWAVLASLLARVTSPREEPAEVAEPAPQLEELARS